MLIYSSKNNPHILTQLIEVESGMTLSIDNILKITTIDTFLDLIFRQQYTIYITGYIPAKISKYVFSEDVLLQNIFHKEYGVFIDMLDNFHHYMFLLRLGICVIPSEMNLETLRRYMDIAPYIQPNNLLPSFHLLKILNNE